MKFKLDTEQIEDSLKLTFTKKEQKKNIAEGIQEFCYGMALFFMDFAQKLDCDEKQAAGLKDVCLDVIGRDIDAMIHDTLCNKQVDPEEMEDLTQQMEEAGFSDEEIQNAVRIVKSCGGIASATEYLKSIGEEHGIKFDENNS